MTRNKEQDFSGEILYPVCFKRVLRQTQGKAKKEAQDC